MMEKGGAVNDRYMMSTTRSWHTANTIWDWNLNPHSTMPLSPQFDHFFQVRQDQVKI